MSKFKHECEYCHKEFESRKLRAKCCSNLCTAKLRNKEKAVELKEYHKKYYTERNHDSIRQQQNENYFQKKFGKVRPYKHRKGATKGLGKDTRSTDATREKDI